MVLKRRRNASGATAAALNFRELRNLGEFWDQTAVPSGSRSCDLAAGLATIWTRGSKNNAQATRAETLRAFMTKRPMPPPETDREPAFGELGVTTSSKFKARKFWRGVCVRWRQFDRGVPGGGLARSSAAIYG